MCKDHLNEKALTLEKLSLFHPEQCFSQFHFKRYHLSNLEGINKPPFYKVNMRVFRFFKLSWLVSFEPLEIQKRYIPLLKGLSSDY